MAITFYIANSHSFFLVPTHHRRACHTSRALLCHPVFLRTFFQPTSLSGLLRLYIRRGDYTDHCTKLEVFANFGDKMFTALVALRETFIWSIVMGEGEEG